MKCFELSLKFPTVLNFYLIIDLVLLGKFFGFFLTHENGYLCLKFIWQYEN